MAILTEKLVWRRPTKRNRQAELSLLTRKEEENVRRALVVLLVRHGNWRRVAKVLQMNRVTITRVINRHRRTTAELALRVARVLAEPLADVLSGAFPREGECPMCRGTGRHEGEWEWRHHYRQASGRFWRERGRH